MNPFQRMILNTLLSIWRKCELWQGPESVVEMTSALMHHRNPKVEIIQSWENSDLKLQRSTFFFPQILLWKSFILKISEHGILDWEILVFPNLTSVLSLHISVIS